MTIPAETYRSALIADGFRNGPLVTEERTEVLPDGDVRTVITCWLTGRTVFDHQGSLTAVALAAMAASEHGTAWCDITVVDTLAAEHAAQHGDDE